MAEEVTPPEDGEPSVDTEATVVTTEKTPEGDGRSASETTTTSVTTTKPMIMQGLVNQPTWQPTNKLIASAIGSLVAVWIKYILVWMWPDLDVPELWDNFPAIVGFLVGYFLVKDMRNS